MTPSPRQYDPWNAATLLLWVLFFLPGLMPEWAFELLRGLGHVTTQRAMVNSHYLITLTLAAYLACFALRCCGAAGLDSIESSAKALQIGVVALLAFLPVPLDKALHYQAIPVPFYRHLLLSMSAGKCLAWLYLLSIVIRYYSWGGDEVFRRMPCMFPSVHRHRRERRSPPAACEEPGEPGA